MYASNPGPPIPFWIAYHWRVFRARETNATLTVSDRPKDDEVQGPFGIEQTYKVLEIHQYHE